MKLSILWTVGLAASWVAFTPAPCRAQFEIAPDHFEMINVEPNSKITSSIAANRDLRQRQILDEGQGNNNHSFAGCRVPGKDESKDVGLQFDLFASAIVFAAWKYDATQPPRAVQAIERIWKQARVKLNYFTYSREAAFSREALQRKS